MSSIYDQEYVTEMYERSLRAEGSLLAVLNMFKQKLIDLTTATKALNMSESEFLKLV